MSFMSKVKGLVGLFTIHEYKKHWLYEAAYKMVIMCRLIELMISGYQGCLYGEESTGYIGKVENFQYYH